MQLKVMGISNFVKLFVGIVFSGIFQQKGSCFITSDVILCEQSNLDITCPNATLITNVNITLPNSTINENVCTKPESSKEGVLYNETIMKQCIGHRLCRIAPSDIDFTQTPDQTWKLKIHYNCRRNRRVTYKEQNICPDNPLRLKCGKYSVHSLSVSLENRQSLCIRPDVSWCTSIIQNRTRMICNKKEYCVNIKDKTPDSYWNSCIQVPKYVFVSFSCSDYIQSSLSANENTLQSNIPGISIGVSAGIIMIVLVILILFRRFKVRRNSQIVIYENTNVPAGKYSETATNVAQGNYMSLQQTRDVPNYTELKTLKTDLNNEIQGNYTSLEQSRDVSNYTELNYMNPDLSLTKEHNYIEVF